MTHVHGDMIKEDLIMKDKFAINSSKAEEKATQTAEPEVKEPATEEQYKQEKILGTVVNCAKLRIREHPNINAIVAAEIEKGSEVKIDESKSTAEFYAVITGSGLEGYCMKDYIQIK